MNSMVKNGWIEKIEHDEGLGRSEQIWCITKSGRLAAQTENDAHVEPSELDGFSICDYSPALNPHTKLVQIIANKLSQRLQYEELKPFNVEVTEYGRIECIYPDIIFDTGVCMRNDSNVSSYDFYEIELTVKPLKHYKDFLIRAALHNELALQRNDGYVIGNIFFITTAQLSERLREVLIKIRSNINVYLFSSSEVLADYKLDLETAKIELPRIEENDLELRKSNGVES